MFKEKVIAVGIAIGLCVLTAASAEGAVVDIDDHDNVYVSAAKELDADTGNRTQVSGKYSHESSKWLETDINLPVVGGLTDKNLQEQLNQKIEMAAIKDRESIAKQAGEYALIAEKQGWPVRPFSLTVDFSIKANTENVLSFAVTTYPFTGGTGATRVDYYNIDKKNIRLLKLKDLFIEGTDYITRVNQEVSAQIAKQEESGQVTYFKEKMGFATIKEEQGFYLEDGDLVIGFPKYSIAPGYMGNPEFRISMESWKEYLNNPALSNREFCIIDKEIRGTSGAMDVHMKIPVIQGLKDREYQQKMNRLVMDKAFRDRQAVKIQADKHLAAAKESGVKLVPYGMTVGYALEEKEGGYCLQVNTTVTTQTESGTIARQEKYVFSPQLDLNTGTDWAKAPVMVHGKPVSEDGRFAYISDQNAVMLPLRNVAEALGYGVEYRYETNSVEMTAKDGRKVFVMLNSKCNFFPDAVIFSQTAPKLIDDSAYVPVGFISWALGADICMNQNGTVDVTVK